MFSALPDTYYYRTANVGQTVKFPCHTKLLEDVNWERLDTPTSGQRFIYLGNLGLRDLGHDPRFTVLDKNHSHSLVIYNVTVGDSAYYRCQEDAGLGNRRFCHLSVEGECFFFCSVRLVTFVTKLLTKINETKIATEVFSFCANFLIICVVF